MSTEEFKRNHRTSSPFLLKTVRSIDEEAAAGEAGMVPPLEESGAEDASGFSALGKIRVLTIQLACRICGNGDIIRLTQKNTSSKIKKMAPIGTELKRERELRGISLQEISDATKINIRYLRDLEEERLDSLPGRFFTKGILRTYARYIGLEEDAVLNSFYESEQLHEHDQKQEKKERETQFILPAKVKKRLLYISLFLILMTALTLSFIFIYQKPQEQKVEESPSAVAAPELRPLPPPETQLPVVQKQLVLDLSFQMETWIEVYADGELVISGTKWPGEKAQVIAQEELLIHTGNAGGMSFMLNDKKGKSLGSSGAVVKDVRITLDNMDEFIERDDINIIP